MYFSLYSTCNLAFNFIQYQTLSLHIRQLILLKLTSNKRCDTLIMITTHLTPALQQSLHKHLLTRLYSTVNRSPFDL